MQNRRFCWEKSYHDDIHLRRLCLSNKYVGEVTAGHGWMCALHSSCLIPSAPKFGYTARGPKPKSSPQWQNGMGKYWLNHLRQIAKVCLFPKKRDSSSNTQMFLPSFMDAMSHLFDFKSVLQPSCLCWTWPAVWCFAGSAHDWGFPHRVNNLAPNTEAVFSSSYNKASMGAIQVPNFPQALCSSLVTGLMWYRFFVAAWSFGWLVMLCRVCEVHTCVAAQKVV